jgi:DNA-binding transcriptional LysR family regulator
MSKTYVSGNDFFFVREAIAAGLGVGPLPSFIATHEVAAGRAGRVPAHLREHVPRILGLA